MPATGLCSLVLGLGSGTSMHDRRQMAGEFPGCVPSRWEFGKSRGVPLPAALIRLPCWSRTGSPAGGRAVWSGRAACSRRGAWKQQRRHGASQLGDVTAGEPLSKWMLSFSSLRRQMRLLGQLEGDLRSGSLSSSMQAAFTGCYMVSLG